MLSALSSYSSNMICCYAHPEAPLIEDYRAGDQICSECGLVVGDRTIDVGAEWRSFSNENGNPNPSDRSRVGGMENPLLKESLTTIIGPVGVSRFSSGSSKTVSTETLLRQPLRNRSNLSNSDRSLITAFREISAMADRLHLTRDIIDRANIIFKQVQETARCRCKVSMAAACLYISCRQEGYPRSFKEVCAVSTVGKREIGRAFRAVVNILETSLSVIKSGDFMPRFCGNLGLTQTVTRAAYHIAKKALDLDLVNGRSPISVAAAAIYMASQASEEKRSQREIGEVTGVAENTIRQSYRLMYPHAVTLFPQNFKFVTPISQLPHS